MKKAMRILVILTIIMYINNFVFAYINSYKTLTGISTLWSISPYLLLTLSSFILASDYKKEYLIVKKEARISMVLKILACIVAFYNYKFEIGSIEYFVRFIILFILFIANMIIEIKMYKIGKNYVPINQKDEFQVVTERDKWNMKKYGRASTLGLTSFMLFTAGGMNIVFITQVNKFYSLICICIFIVFLKMNYDKNRLAFVDQLLGKRIFYRDMFFATIGFIYNFIIAFKLLPVNEMITNTALIVGVLFLYPTITTNRKISIKYQEISKVVGDKFEYYFNDENNPYK
ncbi:hypothetical protein [Bacillus wiedmannii]|uniref:hypothetical protein n=1 Tax=Bacillus wiedmannii TaxID=1890302 RepID=UPI003F9353C4